MNLNPSHPSAHVVLPSTDGSGFHSLRRPPSSRAARLALGRELRARVPRRALGLWQPPADRDDPVRQIHRSHDGRLEHLVAVRVGRMTASPYGFLRGSPMIMAADVGRLPVTGITPVICGDAHLGNFGFYASPERELVIDLNDFDEAHPGAWEWDLWRLVASVWVAGRQNGLSEQQCADSVRACVAFYRREIRRLAGQPLLVRNFERIDVRKLHDTVSEQSLRDEIIRAERRARASTGDRALPRLTAEHEGARRIVARPPLVTRVPDDLAGRIGESLDHYLDTIPPHWRRTLGGYTLVDIAHKVVGVGSVGLRAYVALLTGSSPDDVLFLQIKQARRSVVAPFVHGDNAWHAHQGQRVVEYQQELQTVSDPLLGWTTIDGLHFYVRQYRDMKGSVDVDALDARALADYSGILGLLLAKGHARTSGASMIAGYVGHGTSLDDAMAAFAQRYADQVESDHAALVRAVQRGELPCESGV